jgi:uncharacterized protein (TIGR03437 family)
MAPILLAAQPVALQPIVQSAEFTATSQSTQLGYSLAVDGDVAVVGAPGTSHYIGITSPGFVNIYARTGGAWSLQSSIQQPPGNVEYAKAVAVSGGTVVVSGSVVLNGGNVGAVYVYTQSGSTWSQQAVLTASDIAPGDSFGSAVAVNGGTIVVGAPGKNTVRGAAYVFTLTGSGWTQQAELTASDGVSYDGFGDAAAVSGGTAVIGAASHNSGRGRLSGAAYVFTQTGSTWSEQAELTALDGAPSNSFGSAVAVNGHTIAVGANAWSNYRGAAYIFTRAGTAWIQASELTLAGGAAYDYFGNSVALSGGTVVVGAPGRNQNTGAAYAYLPQAAGWNLQATVTAGDAAPNTAFAGALAFDGSTLLAGDIGGTDSLPQGGGAWYAFQVPTVAPLNGASLVAGPIAPGEVVTLLANLGPTSGAVASPSSDGLLPTELAGVQVLFDGVAAPIFYAQQQQINVQAPFELRNPTTQIQVQYGGMATWPTLVAVNPAAPAIFHAGESSQVLMINQDTTQNSAANPAAVGSVVALWGTGGGASNPPGITGGFTPLDSLASLALPVTVTVGSTAVQATITYSGVAPTLSSSVFQINFEIPVGTPTGPNVPLKISIGGVTSTDPPGGTTIAVK